MKKLLILFIGSFVSVFWFMQVGFSANFGSGEVYNPSDPLMDDTYIATGKATLDENVEGDFLIAGGEITINGNISEDLVIVGGTIEIMGDVGDDIRIIGGEVAIYGNVGDDVLVAGGKVDIEKDAVINGSVIAGAGLLTIDGVVREDIRGGMGMFFLNGRVERNVTVTIEEKIEIEPSAFIGGNLTYSALLNVEIPEGVVKGAIEFNKFERESILKDLTLTYLIYKFVSFIASLILALILVLSVPKVLIRSAELTRKGFFKSMGIGILLVFFAVIGFILLMVTVVGIPLGLILLATMLIVFYFAKIFTAAWLSSYFLKLNNKKKHQKLLLFLGITAALFVYYLIGIIPFVGWALNILLFLIGVGTIARVKFDYFKEMKEKNIL